MSRRFLCEDCWSKEHRVTELIPIGYQTFREAVGCIEAAMFAGKPDRPAVAKARAQEGDVGDLEASRKAAAELWKAVDQGAVRPMAIGGYPRKVVRMSAAMTLEIPVLRRVGGFTFLRPRHRHHAEIAGWFGVRQLPGVALAFREREVERLCARLRRGVRRTLGSAKKKSKVGRPTRQPAIRSCISELVGAEKWHSAQSIKTLTHLVNKALKRTFSDDTMTRALDQIYADTGDRRFQRHRRTRKA
jgi:hypothetical protein